MNKKIDNRKNSDTKMKMLLSQLLIFFIIFSLIAAFYLLSDLFSLNSRKPRRIDLPQNLFNNEEDISWNFELSKFDLPSPIYSIDVLKNNSIVFISTNRDTMRSAIYILDLEEFESGGSFTPLNINNQGIFHVSPDGEKIIFNDGKFTDNIVLYDVDSQEETSFYKGMRFCAWLPGSNAFVAVYQDSLVMVDLQSQSLKKIADIKAIYKQISKETNIAPKYLNLKSNAWNKFLISMDSKYIYYQHWDESSLSTVIYCINLENGKLSALPLNGQLMDFDLLSNGNIIFTGIIDNSEGLYIYNVNSLSVKKILSGNIYGFRLSPDKEKIIYGMVNRQRSTELHLASIEKQRLSNDKIILSDPNFMFLLCWNPDGDMFFLSTGKLGGSTVYRFKQIQNSLPDKPNETHHS